MPAYSLKAVQLIPASIDTAWSFFSSAANLPLITPPYMRFKIISQHHGDTLYAGQIIEYNCSPVLGIPLYWMTEITHVSPLRYFVDEQRFGPYALWHHQHHFKTVAGGTEMTDIVHYKMPLGILGRAAHALLLKKQLQEIFAYRKTQTAQIFAT